MGASYVSEIVEIDNMNARAFDTCWCDDDCECDACDIDDDE